ncbi:unnamed protein product [Paramecium primaurelia]|uniref:WD40-repeat-containing domain n=1 Tax=Paramecium primaurelia TaxID=5886 RepID=A0A8S1PDV4_PARPR|nr:unnamed protein product [Paramecium primaurelia]
MNHSNLFYKGDILIGFNVQFIVRNRILLFQVLETQQQDAGNRQIKLIGLVRNLIKNIHVLLDDILFSGGDDESIKVWKVDFKQNKLTYMYSLDKHDSYVMALSLNQSETQLVSCAYAKNQIIIWEREEQDKFEFKYVVIIIISHFIYKQSIQEYGLKIKFIKDNQFIWITGGKEIDKLYIFELKEGIYQENQKKTIQLNKNNQISDEYHFPIVYNKEKNLIVLRHKDYIYFIKEIINGIFTIVHQFNCDTNQIFGTFTNNGQYLVYWDEKNQGYSVYELLNK